MAAAQASYDERLAKANLQLEEQEAAYKADTEQRAKDKGEKLTKANGDKLKQQEGRFTKKCEELNAKVSRLKK